MRNLPDGQIEVVRGVFEAANPRDVEALLEHTHPECELDWSRSIGPYKGV